MAPALMFGDGASILDIRCREVRLNLRDDIKIQLRPALGGEKRLPTMLLYDERGLKLFEEITFLDEYYLTNAEIEVLERYADQIAERIPHGAQVVELGSGNLRKVNVLLKALDAAKKDVDYYALDLDRSELQRSLSAVPSETYEHVRCHGLYGTYDDGLEWLQRPENKDRAKCVVSLGSSIGNFHRDDAAEFLRSFASALTPTDLLIIGVDGCQDKDRVFHAYNDSLGITHEFVLNGLLHANAIMGSEVFKKEDWKAIGEYDEEAGRHHAFVSPRRDVNVDGVYVKAGERIRIEESYKYSPTEASKLWDEAGLAVGASFADSTGTYHVNMLTTQNFKFNLDPQRYAASAVPAFNDWQQLWACWDLVTRRMITEDALLSKPIKLRNCCLFYLGHIPTFLDIHLTRSTDGKPTEPANYPQIFERGIDPDVENPELCHAHSEIPETWPPFDEVLKFQQDVRFRVRGLYEDQSLETNGRLRRALWLGFEHEAMHLETFLYMLLQSDQVVPPSGVKPDFEAMASEAKTNAVPNKWFKIPMSEIKIGMDDGEDDNRQGHHFGWDNERPARTVKVPSFEAKGRPITNGEYASYLIAMKANDIPASWAFVEANGVKHANGATNGVKNGATHVANGHQASSELSSFVQGKSIRTVYGLIPLAYALSWPLQASYDEIACCASYMGGRIPTVEEARSLYSQAERQQCKAISYLSPGTIPAVNAHLSNEGVYQTPPSDRQQISPSSFKLEAKAAKEVTDAVAREDPTELFADLTGCNVAFKHFHPVPVTQNGDRLAGLGGMGGVWEWTSTPFKQHEGFKAMELYPGYSSDFFDGKHNVVLGGSWATHPRIAGRKSFVNWYQRNYPYAWCGARLVRDLQK